MKVEAVLVIWNISYKIIIVPKSSSDYPLRLV